MKYLICGLGNPGSDYAETRHNIGFKVVEKLAQLSNETFKPDRLAEKTTIKHKGRQLILIKPQTYMNLSGKALNYWMQAEKIPIENVLVITDDLALPFGQIRLRAKGSDGGHNGLKNIQEVLGHSNYARLRFGIGSDFSKGQQVKYVLDEWNDEEKQKLDDKINKASEAVLSFVTKGIGQTMTFFNQK
jgi:PTH1 family peptidyl-tRNA hydrolase